MVTVTNDLFLNTDIFHIVHLILSSKLIVKIELNTIHPCLLENLNCTISVTETSFRTAT